MKKNTRIKRRKYNSRKKYIFPLVALSILLVVSVAGVFAAVDELIVDQSTGLTYKVIEEFNPGNDATSTDDDVNGTVAIVGYDSTAAAGSIVQNGRLRIPATVSFNDRDIDNTDLDDTRYYTEYDIIGIGNYKDASDSPFEDCDDITRIDFSEATNLEYVGQSAFKGCENLTSLDLGIRADFPADGNGTGAINLTKIGQDAFSGCTSLESIDLTDATKLETIAHRAFEGCSALEDIELPASISVIGDDTFKDCVNLTSVTAKDGISNLTKIGDAAFYNCPWLTTFPDLSDSNVTISTGAFWGCCYLDEEHFSDKYDPFNKATIMQNLGAKLRGVSITKIIPSEGDEDTSVTNTTSVPKRFFKEQSYDIDFTTANSNYSIVGLDLLKETDSMPDEYSISDEFMPKNSGETDYSFTIPSGWSSDGFVIFAVATKGQTESGAPTIKTDELPVGQAGETYEALLECSSDSAVTWSAEWKYANDNDSTFKSGLPDNLALEYTTGSDKSVYIAGKPTTTGEYIVRVTAANNVSTHKRSYELNIYDQTLPSMDELKWKESNGSVSVAWTPLQRTTAETINYTIDIYKDGTKVAQVSKSLAGTTSFESEFAEYDVTSILEKNGKGTYTFTVTAESDGYADSYADSTKFDKGSYAYGYKEHTITATATGEGTGKISLSDESYSNIIPKINAYSISNGMKVEVYETAVSEATPLKFIFTPDKGCEVVSLTVDGVTIKKNKESYTFTSIDEVTTESSSDSSSGTSSDSSSSDSSSDSGVIVASSTTLNADSSGSTNHTIVVEFGLVSNRIDGDIVTTNTYIQGNEAGFEAIGDGMDSSSEVDGDTRWIPVCWWLDDKEKTNVTTTHTWTKSPYTDAIDTTNLSLGTHTLYVEFQKQNYVGGTGWVDSATTNSTDVRSVDFTVTDKSGNTTDPDADTDGTGTGTDGTDGTDGTSGTDGADGKDGADGADGSDGKDGSSGTASTIVDKVTSALSGVDTSDDMVMGLWVTLALASLIGIGFCIRQIIRFA